MTQEALFYNRLNQRFPVNQIINYLENRKNETLEIHTDRFVKLIDSIIEINPYYAKSVVKVFIDNIGSLQSDTSNLITIIDDDENGLYLEEWLFEKYIELLNVKELAPTDSDILQYTFNDKVKISIEETPNVISSVGTTGFRTWEAALFLTNYLIENDINCISPSSNILELGAGTGIVSIGLYKKYKCDIGKLYITDGDSQLIEGQLSKNCQLNKIVDREVLKIEKLWWNLDPVPTNINLIVAADVTYDSSVVPDLCKTISDCFEKNTQSVPICLLAATIRNRDTINTFENECMANDLHLEIIQSTDEDYTLKSAFEEKLLFKPLIAPVRIYRICKKNNFLI